MSTENTIAVTEKKATLQDLLADVIEKNPMAGRHSYFQLKYFVVNKEPTVQAKLWQCLREMKARKETLDGIALEKEEIADRIELTRLELEELTLPSSAFGINSPSGEINDKKRAVKERQLQRRLAAMEKSLADLDKRQRETEEEAAFFLQAFNDLEIVEKCKPFDDVEAQMEYWSQRFSHEMNMKLLLTQTVDPELAKAVLSLPDGAGVKKELVGLLTQHQSLIEMRKLEAKKKLTLEGNG
jgi:hypothetical protein